MALARVKVWIPGDVLTAADLNGEFNNVINNPITLISPSTGGINFNLQPHTNLVTSAITASSASAGQALISTGGLTPVWGTPSVVAANLTGFTSGDTPVGTSSGALSAVAIGSTGKVYAVTSSNSSPAWQVIPIDGGLSTATPTGGMLYYISSSAAKLLGLAVGTSGQVLTVSTALLPSWATPAASGGGVQFSSQVSWQDDFNAYPVGSAAGGGLLQTAEQTYWTNAVETFTFITSGQGGVAKFPFNAAANLFAINASSGAGTPIYPFRSTLNPDMTIIYTINSTLLTVGWRLGMMDLSTAQTLTTDPTNGIFVRVKSMSTIAAVARSGGVETVVNTTAVMTSSFKPVVVRLQVTGGGTNVNIYTDGTLCTTAITTNIPSTTLGFAVGSSSAVASALSIDGWQILQDRQTGPYV